MNRHCSPSKYIGCPRSLGPTSSFPSDGRGDFGRTRLARVWRRRQSEPYDRHATDTPLDSAVRTVPLGAPFSPHLCHIDQAVLGVDERAEWVLLANGHNSPRADRQHVSQMLSFADARWICSWHSPSLARPQRSHVHGGCQSLGGPCRITKGRRTLNPAQRRPHPSHGWRT